MMDALEGPRRGLPTDANLMERLGNFSIRKSFADDTGIFAEGRFLLRWRIGRTCHRVARPSSH
jgi:hypothetical protein